MYGLIKWKFISRRRMSNVCNMFYILRDQTLWRHETLWEIWLCCICKR